MIIIGYIRFNRLNKKHYRGLNQFYDFGIVQGYLKFGFGDLKDPHKQNLGIFKV